MKNKGFIKLYRSMLSKPEMTDLVNEQGAVGFGVYMMIVLYLSQCDDFEGAYTNGQLQILADQARKSRAYIRHIIEDYGLFVIEGKRFHESFMTQYSHARKDMYAGEDIEIDKEKENKEKGAKVPDMIGPSAYERVTRSKLERMKTGTYRRVCNHCKWLYYVKPSRDRRILRELEQRKNH
jgi:hypothetical protein